MSTKGLKIIQLDNSGNLKRPVAKQLIPHTSVLAAIQREDVVAATLLVPNPRPNPCYNNVVENIVQVYAYRY